MTKQHFTATFSVDKPPQQVFDAINDVRGWWTGDIEGRTDTLGAEFTYRYQDLHRTTQKITEWVPGERVVWHVVGGQINFVKNKTEWDGTDIVFEIRPKGDQTEVHFTHVGLGSDNECYEACSDGWSYYMKSLRERITTGKPQ